MPGQQIQKGTTYVNYPALGTSQVTAENLNNHVDNAILLPGAISSQTESSPQEGDYVMVERSGALFKYTIQTIRNLLATISNGFVSLTGSTMTGPLILNSSSPGTAATAASKGYVDATTATAVPTGVILMWGKQTLPTGWIECNGQSTAGYPALTALYGTNVPDLRGEFVRGWDGSPGRGVDPGRGILSLQSQDIQPHTHTYGGMQAQGYEPGNLIYATAGNIANTGSTGNTETRPRNVALMFIIKT